MSEDATSGVGASLREARERAGLSLRAISDRTKIPVPTLDAIERDQISRLPGGIFLRAFIRTFAREVGVDPEQSVRRFVARYPDAAAAETPSPHVISPEPIAVDEHPAAGRLWRVLGWSLPLLLVIVYFGFGGRLSWWRQAAAPAAARAEAQAELAAGSPAPVLTTPVALPPASPPVSAEPAAAGSEAGTSPNGVAPTAAPVNAAANAASAPVTPAVAPATGGAAAPGPRAGDQPARPAAAQPQGDAPTAAPAAPAAGQFEVTLASRGQCWVSVSSDGKIVYAAMMNAGERRNLKLGGHVSLTVGSAGVIDLALNGKQARALGAQGEVKTLLLNADNLATFLATR